MVASLSPDVVVATEPQAGVVGPSLRREFDVDILEPGTGMRPDVSVGNDSGCAVLTLPMGEEPLAPEQIRTQVERASGGGGSGTPVAAAQICVINQTVSLSVNPYARSATLADVSSYRSRIPDRWWTASTIHLSTALRAGFTTTRVQTDDGDAQFVGIGTSNADLGVGTTAETAHATLVAVYSNGAIDVSEIDPRQFGLRGVPEIGPARFETLRNAGITTVGELADTPLRELTDLSGLGRTSANTVRTAAEARATDSVLPTGDDSLPNQDPVFIDIETDGLHPSTAWLIGVLDGGPEDGHYMSFRERAVGDGSHLRAFLTWLTGAATGRPVVAWNGYRFDFPVITDQLRQHHPELVERWTDRYQFDALWWATTKNGGNAALPGRTNKLEHVAEALGWEPSTNGIDGATVAALYTAYRSQVAGATGAGTTAEPDWDRLERYCEDDVRALATIYEHLDTAARQDAELKTPTGENSSQGSLADFS
ncbi:hypothetical protein GCM10008995_12450 [Halobellus salinus]|uniref:YprB ribonuclease H-like domain-containing protein n=1 Tax=Halobellus salinus TaxID=931585 RepID=A0A830EM26_9EURY|nr:ribonuclease H-like domain-containing protein [Halobellus salinus]GGJ04169.1 hypothetical protein GCM10008995_12450 [Halobellus salinus]SMP08401.1 RNase_H superfamily protein [Halobellus salinus]